MHRSSRGQPLGAYCVARLNHPLSELVLLIDKSVAIKPPSQTTTGLNLITALITLRIEPLRIRKTGAAR